MATACFIFSPLLPFFLPLRRRICMCVHMYVADPPPTRALLIKVPSTVTHLLPNANSGALTHAYAALAQLASHFVPSLTFPDLVQTVFGCFRFFFFLSFSKLSSS